MAIDGRLISFDDSTGVDEAVSHGETRSFAIPLIVLIVLTVAVYARTIGFGFFQDDYLLARPWSAREVLDTFHGPFDPTSYNDPYFRPFASLSFATEWGLWGTTRWGYHVTNIVLHTAATLLVWRLLLKVRVAAWAAVVGAAFFAVVPANVATVVYIAERTDAMVAICIVLGMLCVHRYDQTHRVTWLVWLNIALVAAILSKEVGVAMVPFAAAYWLYLRLEDHDPLTSMASGATAGVATHWRHEAALILRSITSRSGVRDWFLLIGPLVAVTGASLVYRVLVMPAGSFGDRFAETQNPLSALLGGLRSTVKGTPWEISGLPLYPIAAAFVLGFVLRPRSRAWRVVLLGLAMMIAGVAPLTFSGGVEPRLLYVAEIGMGVAVAGLAMVYGQVVAAARTRRRNVLAVTGAIAVVSLAAVGAVAVSQWRAQELYAPGSAHQLSYDLKIWLSDHSDGAIPAENLAEIERHLRDAGLIDADGNAIDSAASEGP